MTPDRMDAGASDVLDVVIVGGGPAGTAAAFRAKELGLKLLVIDFDDILKRIRDYPKDKLILPDFGGGDKMAFPAGGPAVSALHFRPIDKDDMCATWRGFYKTFEIPARTGVELSSVDRVGDLWHVNTIDRKAGEKPVFRTKHIVLAIGRGVPRRLDVAGNIDGIAYRMDDPKRFVDGSVLIVGGGTSAAEAVLAISKAKIASEDSCAVYWAFRGTKMPMVSKALADEFFEAYIGNGNIRSLPNAEPLAVVTTPDRAEMLSVRVDRKSLDGRPPETVHYEFMKERCIACIGEDIPEALLASLGINMVPTSDGKKMVVSPLLETEQKNIYLIGDLLSQNYLETDDFDASPETFRKVKHRGNIKSSLRDGVFVAEVIRQKVDGRARVEVVIRDAPREGGEVLPSISVAPEAVERTEAAMVSTADWPVQGVAALVAIGPTGVEAEEYPLKAQGITALGRNAGDITFTNDTGVSDQHASIIAREGKYFLRDDASTTGTYLRLRADQPMPLRDGDLLRVGRQFLRVVRAHRGDPAMIEHYDRTGQLVADYEVKGTLVFGRSGGPNNPDVILDDEDATLSRFHLSISNDASDGGALLAQDFKSRNGSYLKVDAERELTQGDVIRVGGQQLMVRLHEELPEKQSSRPVPPTPVETTNPLQPPAPPPPPPPPPPAPVPMYTPSSVPVAPPTPVATGPFVEFVDQNLSGPVKSGETLLDWADSNDATMDWECRHGFCGCDVIRVLEGKDNLNKISDQELKTLKRKGLEPGEFRLACMTETSGPVKVEVVK